MTATKTLTVRLAHHSSIQGARWATPVGWEPANQIEGAEYAGDGSWWEGSGEESNQQAAGLVCWAEGDEGEEIEVAADDLRVASCGDCRVIGPVEL